MKYRIKYLLAAIIIVLLNFCSPDTLDYIDVNYPSDKPQVFAESIIQQKYDFVQSMNISKDKREYYFQVTNKNWSFDKILCLEVKDNGGYIIDTIIDSKKASLFKYCGEPCISDDCSELFFSTLGDIWKLHRDKDVWSTPIKLEAPVNTDWNDGHPSISKNGTLYFHSFNKDPLTNSVYFSKLEDGKYQTKTKIDILSADGDAGDPGIAPDESLIVFASSRESGYGNTDLYISYNLNKGWTEPKNLGEKINTENWELGAKISSDGKYLFFYRRDNWKNAEYSKIYWVNIHELIKETS